MVLRQVVTPLDADLSAIASLAGTAGLLAKTAADSWALRTLTAPAAGITVSNGTGAGGNPTLALANDLSAVEGLSGTGVAVRTASDTWTTRTITGTANEITLTNGDGASGNPTVSLPSALTFTGKTVTGGTFASLTSVSTASLTISGLTSGRVPFATTGGLLTDNNALRWDGTSFIINRADARFDVSGTKVGGNQWYFQTVDSDGRFRIFDQTTSAERLSITQSGRVILLNATDDGTSGLQVGGSDPRIGLVGTRNWAMQSVDSDGRFRLYDQTGGAERLTLSSAGTLTISTGGITHASSTLLTTTVALTNGAAAATGTLANAPSAGNPTKWVPINDNGTTRYIPAW